MDSLRIGRSLRALRIRRGLRQADVAAAAGVSRSQYGRIERGDLRGVPLDDVHAICRALQADLDVRIRWQGEGLDRLLDEAHAGLVDALVRRLAAAGWVPEVEVSFSIYGERGSIDVLAWHGVARALLVCEVKSVMPDAQAMLSTLDRKARLAPRLVDDRGWQPSVVGRLLAVADSSTTRRRVDGFGALFEAALPGRGSEVRAWLRRPAGPMAGILFLPDARRHGTRRPAAGLQRVNRRRCPRA
jgi:transcriptional regulator with XRE-family HTH domain